MVVDTVNGKKSDVEDIEDVEDVDKAYVYPTDTVWGIGGSIYSEKAIDLICQVKRITKKRPFSIMFSNLEHLEEYFSFPQKFNPQKLKELFSLEVTILVSLEYARKKIPSWITRGEERIAFRCLESNKGIKHIIERVGAPITTTSFNLTGENPIKDEKGASQLFEKLKVNFSNKIELINQDPDISLSGNSSSIVAIDFSSSPLKFEFLRKGTYNKEILEVFRPSNS